MNMDETCPLIDGINSLNPNMVLVDDLHLCS